MNTVAWVVELTYLHVVVKCESWLGGHGKARCTVICDVNKRINEVENCVEVISTLNTIRSTNRKWFSVVCTDNHLSTTIFVIRHHSGQNVAPRESTTNSDYCDDEYSFRKGTDNAEPLSICFLPQYSTPKKVFISERDRNPDTKKEQALSITFSQYDWFISQSGRS